MVVDCECSGSMKDKTYRMGKLKWINNPYIKDEEKEDFLNTRCRPHSVMMLVDGE